MLAIEECNSSALFFKTREQREDSSVLERDKGCEKKRGGERERERERGKDDAVMTRCSFRRVGRGADLRFEGLPSLATSRVGNRARPQCSINS